MQHLDTTDPAALEAALETAPHGSIARVVHDDGAEWVIHRVPGGWYLPGDVAVASGDVADGRPVAVALLEAADLHGEDPGDLL